MDYLNLAYEAWSAAAELRGARERFRRYTYGRQWDDIITAPDGKLYSEGEWVKRTGITPMTNNLVRQLVKSVVGLWRRDHGREWPAEIAAAAARNSLAELDARTIEEYLISGCAIQRVVSERRPSGAGVWVDPVSPARFFCNRFSDPRSGDIELAGMIHDMSPAEAAVRFGGSDAGRRREVAAECMASAQTPRGPVGDSFGDSFFSAPAGRVRLYELWTMELTRVLKCYDPARQAFFITGAESAAAIGRVNRRRAGSARIVSAEVASIAWRCRWLTTRGTVLADYLSPWRHRGHPFAVKFFPMNDGEVHPFVEDVIDQQRCVNRVITLINSIMANSAKGVLLFPEERKPDCYSWEDIAYAWCDTRGVIPVKSSPRTLDMPAQVNAVGATADAHRLLSTQLELMEQISGVSSTFAGKGMGGNPSAQLLSAYAQHSTTALADLLESFASFVDSRNRLLAQTQ